MIAAIQANTTFQITPSKSCATDPIGAVENRPSQLCAREAVGKSNAAKKQRMNKRTNVAERLQASGTIRTGP
jgi:hypothetical protein